ncbi:hypothetical protein [Enterococcus lactis]|uniref:hypothetical protein n=1 Tax=Enterococcus lactis TaxID=357441 RepID=UPI0031CD8D37
MSVKDVAKKQILKMEHIIDQINEAEDLLISLKSPALNNLNELTTDISIGVPTQFLGRGFSKKNKAGGIRSNLNVILVSQRFKKKFVILFPNQFKKGLKHLKAS